MKENTINPLFPLFSYQNEYTDNSISASSNDDPLDIEITPTELYSIYFKNE